MERNDIYNDEERAVVFGLGLMCLTAFRDDGIISWEEYETIRRRIRDRDSRKKTIHTITETQPILLNEGECPVWEKVLLTIQEASDYFGIGTGKLRDITAGETNDFVLWNGNKRMIKREALAEYLKSQWSI